MTDVRTLLRRLVADAAPAELPDLVAELAGAHAAALARLVTPTPTPAPTEERLVDAATMAEILGTPENWVRDAARAGRIPSVRLGHYVRFRPSDVFEAAAKLPAARNGRLCIPKKSQQIRGKKSTVSNECPSSQTPGTAENRAEVPRG